MLHAYTVASLASPSHRQAMKVDIRDLNLLRLRLSRSDNERQPVSFLVGAPFSLDGDRGVPNVEGFIDVVRERVGRAGPEFSKQLDAAIGAATGPQRYQQAMSFVYDAIDAHAAADIVRDAVLKARKKGASKLDTRTDFDGNPSDWEITRGQRGLARVMGLDVDRFPGPIFTTNFDPLIELALEELGFVAKTINIPLDSPISTSVKRRKSEIDVFHIHGYWRRSSTLHRPQQLLAPRPYLQQSIQRHLDHTHLVVMAYSGWDDVFTGALVNCLIDANFNGSVSWCFYDADPTVARARNEAIIERLMPGVLQGKVSFYCGIDCHTFFDGLANPLNPTLIAQPAVEPSPLPGWQIVTPDALEAESALSSAEAIRFFDGAVPTLRHAISPLIPQLSHASMLISRLAADSSNGCRLQLVRAAGGEGKSTALLQAAAQMARAGSWTLLYRPASDAGLNPDVIAQLDPAKRWLIVADDAEGLVEDLWSAADKLHRAGRQNVFFLIAARDTDWRLRGGDGKSWSTRLNKLEDVTLGAIATFDAGLVVDAWAAQGDEGLRALKALETRQDRVAKLVHAARAQEVLHGEGSFFGGLLATRFSEIGLIEHLLPLLDSLRQQSIEGGTGTLFDALLYIANCHAAGLAGLDDRVLAELCGVPVFRVPLAVVLPLGKELGTAVSRGHVLTRHRRVAEAALVAAVRTGCDLSNVWRNLVRTTIRLSRTERFDRGFFNYIAHSGTKLMSDLPQSLQRDVRGAAGIAAAETAVAEDTVRLSPIVDLARALRFAGYVDEAYELLSEKFPQVRHMVDKAENIRGYFYEWSTCAGNLEHRHGWIADAWLAACSISDSLPVEVTLENAMRACNGLGVAFGHLASRDPDNVYVRARRAVTALGWQTNPDSRAAGYLDRTQRELDALGVPVVVDNDQAISWLSDGATAAWGELDDNNLRRLKADGSLGFKRLRARLTRS
jgi:SIR2-like domain